jgi:hypothetical protein
MYLSVCVCVCVLLLDHREDRIVWSNRLEECRVLALQRPYTTKFHSLHCKIRRMFWFAFFAFVFPEYYDSIPKLSRNCIGLNNWNENNERMGYSLPFEGERTCKSITGISTKFKSSAWNFTELHEEKKTIIFLLRFRFRNVKSNKKRMWLSHTT